MLSTEPAKHHSQRPMNSSHHNKKIRKKKSHPHIEYLQEHIDTLKKELNEIKDLESKQQEELTPEEKDLVEKKSLKEIHLEHTMTILNKFNETTMMSRSISFYEAERKKKNDVQILSILQFFYIVRLGQQGLFSIIAKVAPLVDIDSLTNICDQLVGASLYATKDPSFDSRRRHRTKLFDILHKLEIGLDEPVCDGATTTFKQVKDLVDHILENTKDEQTVMQHYSKLSKQNNNNDTLVVMPYQSMMTDLSSQIQLEKKVAEDNEEKEVVDKSKNPNGSVTTAEEEQAEELATKESSENKDDTIEDIKETQDDDTKSSVSNQEQEETNKPLESDKLDADEQAVTSVHSESNQYNSESDNWRQRRSDSDGTRHPRSRGRGGRGRGGSNRGFMRGGGRGRGGLGKRPKSGYHHRSGSGEEQNNSHSEHQNSESTT